MQPFFVLIGEIFLISCINSILEIFIDTKKNELMGKIINVACYIGSLYLLVDFIFNNIIRDISTLISFPF